MLNNTQSAVLSPIIVAMDFSDSASCLQLASRLDPSRCRLKVGKELFTVAGPQLVGQLIEAGFEVFLDLKYHDIPNTVAKAIKAAADMGVWMVNVHALGGRRMLEAAKNALEQSMHPPLLIAVTMLTSMNKEDLLSIGVDQEPEELVLRLSTLAKDAGFNGVVCSAMEASRLKAVFGSQLCLVTPGIRLKNAPSDDQERIVTPRSALNNGSDYLVIGRPITQADDPLQACDAIYQSLLSLR